MSERIVLYGGVVGDYDGAYDWIKESDYGRPENSPGFHACYPGPSYTVLEVVDAALAQTKEETK